LINNKTMETFENESKLEYAKGSQNKLIAKHLINGYTINPMEALKLYGCFRLAARINDLRNEGMEITSTRTVQGRKHFTTYSIYY